MFDTVGICHAGFGSGAEALFPMVEWATRGETRILSVVGHSLGGAMALGVGARLIAAGRRVRIVTFGAPRVAFFCNFALRRRSRPLSAAAAVLSPCHRRRHDRNGAGRTDRQPR